MRLKSLVLFLTAIFYSSSLGLEWAEDDAIYIEDGVLQRVLPEPEEVASTAGVTDNPNVSNVTGSSGNDTSYEVPKPIVVAIPVEVVLGQCVKFSQCYPIVFYPREKGPDGEPKVMNRNLYDFILSTSDVCEPSDLPEGRSSIEIYSADVYIWCPKRTFPPRPQEIKRVKSEETEVEISCGPVITPPDVDEDDPLVGRVVGGEEAGLGEFPWTVALLSRGRQFCGGSLLDENYVLLAAHCVSHLKSRHLKNLRVLIGDHDIKDPNDTEHQERNVSAIVYHRKFSTTTVHSDIALIRLSEPVQLADNVAPICLSDGNSPFDDGETDATLVGWGQTGENEVVSTTLLKTEVRIWTQEDCIEKYKGQAPVDISEEMFCAGSTTPTIRDACRGDSGGPLSVVRNNRTEQVGIVSWGIGCGQYPGVFVRVPKFLDWIAKHRSLSRQYFLH